MTEQSSPARDQASGTSDGPTTPADIVRGSGRLRSEHLWEVLREYLHPMVMQNHSGATIADAFGVSIDTAYRWKRRLLEDLRKEAVTMQPRDFIMESVSSLRNARSEAWAGYHSSVDGKDKRAYLNTVIQAEAQFARMGERIGLYGRPGQSPMDGEAYGEVRDGDQSNTMMVRELQYRLVELLSTSDSEIERLDENTSESYDDLLSELREEPSVQPVELPPSATIPVRRRRRSP